MANDSPAAILFDIYGNSISETQLIISTNNSTMAPLSANASFTGTADQVIPYHCTDINLAGSPLSSAPGTLYFEFSPDGTHWDVSVPLALQAPTIIPLALRNILPYFRIRYINGNTALTEFRLTCMYRREGAKQITRLASQTIDVNEPLEVTRALISAQYPDSSHNYLKANALGYMLLDTSAPQMKTEYDMSSSTVNYIGTAVSGTATSAASWTIKKITYDGSGNPQEILWTGNTAVWNNRTSENYS